MTAPRNNLIDLIAIALLSLALVLLCGCTETRAERQADTEKRDTFTVEGDAAVPMPQGGTALVPVRFTVERVGSERLIEHSESKTKIDSAAIAQQVGGVIGKSLDAAVAKITGLQPQATSQPWGITPTEGGLAGGVGGVALLAGREWLARRREQQALTEVKAARDRAQAEALDLAKRIDPKALLP